MPGAPAPPDDVGTPVEVAEEAAAAEVPGAPVPPADVGTAVEVTEEAAAAISVKFPSEQFQ